MKLVSHMLFLIMLFGGMIVLPSMAIEVERFEHLNTRDGLSQNSVLSAFCDSRGFLWFGTMNGLNRYDGYEFRIYKARPGHEYSLSNNRITKIWEDRQNFLWLQSHDGYFHYMDPETEKFYTFPFYHISEEEKNSEMSCFYQSSENQIWLGSTNSGVYRLNFNQDKHRYDVHQFLSRGINSITNNRVNFVFGDSRGNIWIGTAKGLNMIRAANIQQEEPPVLHYHIISDFTSVVEHSGKLWFGTRNQGIIVYDLNRQLFYSLNDNEDLAEINLLYRTGRDQIVIGTANKGLFIYYPRFKEFIHFDIRGSAVKRVFEDSRGLLWVNSENFGVVRVDPDSRKVKHFELTPAEIQPLIDNERQYFYEDSRGNLWIGTHGGGLALYDRNGGEFIFFRNDPQDPSTISSNFVHSLTEDKSGLIWVGTGQFNGGINKMIPANPRFDYLIPNNDFSDMSQNVIRALAEDPAGNFWASTKSGDIYIFNKERQLIDSYDHIPFTNPSIPGFNVYTIFTDNDGFIWLGTKGGGLAVSTRALNADSPDYSSLKFYSYQHDPEDTGSIASNMIYSVFQDHSGRIWIGTYENGISIVDSHHKSGNLSFRNINQKNSNLSSNEVRYIYEDTNQNLWFATTFGLSMLPEARFSDSASFRVFNYDPSSSEGISYNDIIHIYEDSRQRLWFGTFGGGIDMVENIYQDDYTFKRFRQSDGLVNDAVFGILEDKEGFLWFSTENGISRYNPVTGIFENYDEKNGLQSSNFNENTCLLTRHDDLIFGTTKGLIFVHPDIGKKEVPDPAIVITGFSIFNEDANYNRNNSPLNSTIETSGKIDLNHRQSSFSFEFSAMSFIDPAKNMYSYMLENFDQGWIDAGRQRIASYTNLPPGEYIFKVRTANPDGSWSRIIRTLPVTIHPPWWLTPWAYGVYALIFLLLAEVARRIITRYARMRNDLKVERRVNEIKLQFFTNISHEIRTPLTLILGPIDDMKKSRSLPDSLKKSVEIMDRNGQRMLRLINQLLDFRKIQNQKMKLKVSEVEYVSFVKSICDNFRHFARQKKIEFLIDLPVKKYFLWIDPEKMDSVFFNILSNAFKFTRSGRQIRVSFKEEEDFMDIIINDQGKGISKERLSVIFDRYTSHDDENDYFSGTGIGLALSKEMVKMHRGEILVESEPEVGSTFIVRLPKGMDHFSRDEIAEKSSISSHHLLPEFNMPDDSIDRNLPQIIIVEDNLEIIDYLKNSMKGLYQVTYSTNGKEGLRLIKEKQPQLVITDIMMPEMDGIQMTSALKADFATSHIPIVMLTAKSNIENQIEGIETGAEAYVLKPFNASYLKAVIGNLLKQRKNINDRLSGRVGFSPGKIKITNRDEEFLNQMIGIIRENYQDPEFNVEKLCGFSNLSRTLFYHKIKALLGITPVEFLKQMRLKIAAQMLRESPETISSIIYLCGFNDEKYFRKCFKDYFRMTPGAYRKSFKDKPDQSLITGEKGINL